MHERSPEFSAHCDREFASFAHHSVAWIGAFHASVCVVIAVADSARVRAVFRSIDSRVDLVIDDVALVAHAIALHDLLPSALRHEMLAAGHAPGFVNLIEAIGVRALRAHTKREDVLRNVRMRGIQAASDELALDKIAIQLLRESQAAQPSDEIAAILADIG